MYSLWLLLRLAYAGEDRLRSIVHASSSWIKYLPMRNTIISAGGDIQALRHASMQ